VTNATARALPGLPSISLTVAEQTGFDSLRVTQGFSSPIAGFGDRIQSATFGAFTARIEAFNAANVSLGVFTVNGNSTDDNDNSAVFLGRRNSALDISRVRLSLTSAQPGRHGPRGHPAAEGEPVIRQAPQSTTGTLYRSYFLFTSSSAGLDGDVTLIRHTG
jgi:hypothetical protein